MKITRLKKYYLDALIFLVAFLYLFPWGYIEKDAYSALVSYDDMHEDEVSDASIHNFVSDTNKAESLYSTLQAVGYRLDGVKNGFQTVPHVFLPKIPKDIKNFSPVHKRKQLFIMVTLPLILHSNELISEDRQRLMDLGRRIKRGTNISYSDNLWLEEMSNRYSAESTNIDDLLERVDIVPVSLALAQAIEESGWGTSRFTHEGNALFGQRIYGIQKDRAGMIPQDADSKKYKVQSYYQLQESVDSYINNLNSHYAYSKFRKARKLLRKKHNKIDPIFLASTLDNYSENGERYTKKLIRIIKANDLVLLDPAKLSPDYFVNVKHIAG